MKFISSTLFVILLLIEPVFAYTPLLGNELTLSWVVSLTNLSISLTLLVSLVFHFRKKGSRKVTFVFSTLTLTSIILMFWLPIASREITRSFIHNDQIAKNKEQSEKVQTIGEIDQSKVLRKLSPRQRQAFSLFKDKYEVTSQDIMKLFNLSQRNAQYLCQSWVEEGFLIISNTSKKNRLYRLADEYEVLIDKN